MRGSRTQRRKRSINQPIAMPQRTSPTTMVTKCRHRVAEGEHASDRRRHGESIQDERGRIIRDALSFENRGIRRGRHMRRAMDSGATASGGETMAPSTNPTCQERPSSQWPAAATATVVNTTQPTASSVIGRKLKRNSRQLIATADA